MTALQTTSLATTDHGTAEEKYSITDCAKSKKRAYGDRWFYPDEMANDLQSVDISAEFIPEVLATAWEYTRVVIPHFTNYRRYIAFTRLIAIAVIAEFKGSLADATGGDQVYGYDLQSLLRTAFEGTVYRYEMCREFRCFLHFTTQKSSEGRNSDQFRTYANCLAHSPQTWFRFRDCDALLRFTFGGALACNDYDQTWYKESELQLLAEIGVTMYDAVAFYKHRTEGEIHSTFGYVGASLRKECYRQCREILWALDVAWASTASHRCILNLLRNFGGPLHMMTRRYRFVEDELTIGQPETEDNVKATRRNFKLWYRIEFLQNQVKISDFRAIQKLEKQQCLFSGFSDIFHNSLTNLCESCLHPQSFGTKKSGQFSCVQLCDKCRSNWKIYMINLSNRSAEVFPFLQFNSNSTEGTDRTRARNFCVTGDYKKSVANQSCRISWSTEVRCDGKRKRR